MNQPLSINTNVHDIIQPGTENSFPASAHLQAVFESAMAGKQHLPVPFHTKDTSNSLQEKPDNQALPESTENDPSSVAFPTEQKTLASPAAGYREPQSGLQTILLPVTEATAPFLPVLPVVPAETEAAAISMNDNRLQEQYPHFSATLTQDSPAFTPDSAGAVLFRKPVWQASSRTGPLLPATRQAALHIALPTGQKTPASPAAGYREPQSGEQPTLLPVSEATAPFLPVLPVVPAETEAAAISMNDNRLQEQYPHFSATLTQDSPAFTPDSAGYADITAKNDTLPPTCAPLTPFIIEELAVQIHALITRQDRYVQCQLMIPAPGTIAITISIHAGELQVTVQAPHEIQKQLMRSQHELLVRLQRRHPVQSVKLDFDDLSGSMQDANQQGDLPDAGKYH